MPANAALSTKVERVVGAATAKQLTTWRIETVGDLLRHLPRRYFAGHETSDLASLVPGEEAAVMAVVLGVRPHEFAGAKGRTPTSRLEVTITDGTSELDLTFFGKMHHVRYWAGQLPRGARGIFAGKVGTFRDRLQLTNPDYVVLDEQGTVIGGAQRNQSLAQVGHGGLIGLYPASRKLPTWRVAECVQLALDSVGELEDPLPTPVREALGVPDLMTALRGVHQPQSRDEVEPARRRLVLDEALAMQVTMALRRAEAAAQPAVPRPRRDDGLLADFDADLPFTLTAGQRQVGEEIFADLAREVPMQRLLQGEVGSGKTLVALRAMLAVVDAGGQAALLAPTEVLASQHLATLQRMLGDRAAGGTLSAAEHATGVVLLTGSMSTAQKREAMLAAASGQAGIVVGTHALLSEKVQFADLGLVVVDEQHRFGVEQRSALAAKASSRPHLLVMTATPIPRSVAMTVFGDLETSTLSELPGGRAEVSTVVVDENAHPGWVQRAWQRVAEEATTGRQAFVVCSRISESDRSAEAVAVDVDETTAPPRTVEDLHAELSAGPLSGLSVEVVHGQLPPEQKDATMARFAAGETDVVVATTVVEVGVDVPNASVMVVSDADRFGISQLHQLRGRIGRGQHPGVCLLLTTAEPGSDARARLDAVAATRDGFALADVDLEQRREGNVLGSRQSGARSSLRLLQVIQHADEIALARQVAEAWVATAGPDDPVLSDLRAQIELLAEPEWLERT
ncbi:ATP-dependent DNA helicase RecG [Auraticoccus monumenti]|uniref:ATP-dependent DNA helicase RecG n=1 Tax=Auraticoccus monumenti TaxID=675864 RepID=A0A1G7D6D1_9ACTN|nr:ATP-dependent DNA helicase RecG [Auraticoccus monumenti]